MALKPVEKVCPPNIGPDNRLFRLAIGAGAIVIAVLVPDVVVKFIMAFAGVVAIAEAVLSHCFVLGAFGRKDLR
jgi:hypothetical protein